MRPPTPSTSSVTPMRSGATSCTLRAKKLRLSNRLARVVAGERREHERKDPAAGHAEDAARGNRDREVGGVRKGARLEIADRRRRRHLHELDARDAPEHLVRRDAVEHDRAEDRAALVAEAGKSEQQQGAPEAVREGEGEDRDSPQRRRQDPSDTLPPKSARRPRQERYEERA